ncbi:MAG TPA: nitroreductase family protein [Caulobacteraceae bacterium]|nr:nitroreductase family protein [Caulobacteraceae bacterium]
MQLTDAILKRRAVRDYAPDPLDEKTATELVTLATWAPTARDQQAWGFVVVRDRQVLERCSAAAKAHMLSLMGEHTALAGFREALLSPAFNIFYNAPALVLICATNAEPMTREDCALAAQTLMLAAADRGLGSCWIGFAEAWLGTPAARGELSLPDGWIPVAPIILGKPAAWPPAPPRRPPDIRWVG